MLNDPIEAWHDAFCSIRSRSGSGSGNSGITWEVMQGELAKVKQTILALPAKQLDIGMVMFAPDDVQGNYLNRVEQMVYRALVDAKPERVKSFKQIRRLSLLVDALLLRCRRELNNPEAKVADAEMAVTLGIQASAYYRDYKEDSEQVIAMMNRYAHDALIQVGYTCDAIHRQYRLSA
ncbi:hypothetical protein [Celerinatantimonas sp. YJH-8]|uniref:hypothetical protein n=1 Tax=Celerinatantimonas sp. YJH-8 TaxID=3228714 RepID=UPI0038C994D0